MNRSEEFEGVVNAHWADILRLGVLMLSDEAEAEEVAQQTFFNAYTAWDRFEGRSSVRTWLFRIAINVCRRTLTTRKRFHGEQLDSHINLAQPQTDARDELRTEKIRQAMQRLAPPHRLILTLFCIEGMKHQEIARIFDVPEGTVWSRLHKARQELKKQFQSIEE
ncbi:MAG: sigma-70 family RNA polymerase sigma factor [Planctomycetaceae bacterium]|nr:sigma-70 family RNA polymerase sigma factor [Planctomycetaceae bacterium]